MGSGPPGCPGLPVVSGPANWNPSVADHDLHRPQLGLRHKGPGGKIVRSCQKTIEGFRDVLKKGLQGPLEGQTHDRRIGVRHRRVQVAVLECDERCAHREREEQ